MCGVVCMYLLDNLDTGCLTKPKCTEFWSEKVPDLSHLGPMWPTFGSNLTSLERDQKCVLDCVNVRFVLIICFVTFVVSISLAGKAPELILLYQCDNDLYRGSPRINPPFVHHIKRMCISKTHKHKCKQTGCGNIMVTY